MTDFFSEDNIALHKEYLRIKRLKYSIFEKSIRGIKGKDVTDILRMRLDRMEKSEILYLLSEITLHNIFFDSFTDCKYCNVDRSDRKYKSSYDLLNDIYRKAMSVEHGFVTVSLRREGINVCASESYIELLKYEIPVLALDVCEHAYFYDYRFDKEKYLLTALPYINLSKI